MPIEEEPIVAMARFIYEISTTVFPLAPSYSDLPMSKQFYWQKVAAQAWETYWQCREAMENR